MIALATKSLVLMQIFGSYLFVFFVLLFVCTYGVPPFNGSLSIDFMFVY